MLIQNIIETIDQIDHIKANIDIMIDLETKEDRERLRNEMIEM